MAVVGSDQITIVDLTDAYSVTLTSEAASFAADKNGKALAATVFTTQVVALRGVETITPSVNNNDIVKPTGITTTVSTSSPYSTMNPGISITVAANASFTNNVAEVDIPIVLDSSITIHKKFSITAAKTGNNGTSMYTYIRYSANASGSSMVETPTASTKYIGVYVGNSSTVPAYTEFKWNKYLGDPGASSYTFVRYSANSDGTDMSSTPSASTLYVGIAVTNVNSAPTDKTKYTWSKYVGDDGADAITLAVTSSNGSIFKNTSVETTLTAHVYKAGAEVTGSALSALGSIKWYKDGSTTPLTTGGGITVNGATVTITAGGVTNKATFEARLEK